MGHLIRFRLDCLLTVLNLLFFSDLPPHLRHGGRGPGGARPRTRPDMDPRRTPGMIYRVTLLSLRGLKEKIGI